MQAQAKIDFTKARQVANNMERPIRLKVKQVLDWVDHMQENNSDPFVPEVILEALIMGIEIASPGDEMQRLLAELRGLKTLLTHRRNGA